MPAVTSCGIKYHKGFILQHSKQAEKKSHRSNLGHNGLSRLTGDVHLTTESVHLCLAQDFLKSPSE